MQRHFHKKLSITLLSPFVYKYIFKHIATNVVIYITKQNDFFSQNFLKYCIFYRFNNIRFAEIQNKMFIFEIDKGNF